jgi:hypothetical protein
MRETAIALMTIFICGCSMSTLLVSEKTSIAEIKRSPLFFNNSVVEVRGYSVMRFEAHFIRHSLDEIDSGSDSNCLTLRPSAQNGLLTELDPSLYHKKRVVVVGVFDKDGDLNRGTLSPISVKVVGSHNKGDIPPPPEPSANNSFKPTPLRGAA